MHEALLSPIEAALEGQRFRGVQLRVFVLCTLIQVSDGFDISTVGMAAPALSHAWGLPAASFTPAFVMSLVGVLVGALLSGPASDRLGRKPVLVACAAIIGIFSLSSAFAGSLMQLTALRFLTGIGIGGAMPTSVALVSDYTPRRHRATVVMLSFTGATLGGFFSGQVAALILPVYGWQGVFAIGGLVPLALVPALLLGAPESVRFLIARGKLSGSSARLFDKLDITQAVARAANMPHGVDIARGNPVAALFRDGFAPRTLLLWIAYFANLLNMFLLGSWMPTVLHLSGETPAAAAFAGSMLSLGGALSALYLGPLIDRFGAGRTLSVNFAAGALFIAAISLIALPHLALLAVIFAAGAATSGSQNATNAFAATLYPARIRTTGVGWALGAGRFGGISGPLLGGILLGLGWSPKLIFLCCCIPALVAAACIALLGRRVGPRDAAAFERETPQLARL